MEEGQINDSHPNGSNTQKEARWYGLFSRGARDWLRHNQKVRETVKKNLSDLVSDLNIQGDSSQRTVRVRVKFLEHYRFALRKAKLNSGVGQGNAKPGDLIHTGDCEQGEGGKGPGSDSGDGNPQFLLELKVDDIVDWFLEELDLPNLQAKSGSTEDDELTREGWDKRGVRARLDRRRTLKEAVKRRAVDHESPAIINDDLRFRQLTKHRRPATEAVVFVILDVSSSMTEHDRKLAKSFFFWTLQGLRRQYRQIETVFVAHTVSAWEFSEEEFFKVSAQGGTVASVAFSKVEQIIEQRFSPDRYNIYLFYASDGENFPQDRKPSMKNLEKLSSVASFIGYLETSSGGLLGAETSTNQIFKFLIEKGCSVGVFRLNEQDDVWRAIRGFFVQQKEAG